MSSGIVDPHELTTFNLSLTTCQLSCEQVVTKFMILAFSSGSTRCAQQISLYMYSLHTFY